MSTSVETVVSMPIINPATGAPSRTFIFAGRVDKIEGTKLIDYKTVADASTFIRRKRIGFQAECYALAMLAKTGQRMTEIEYRLIVRPSITFCKKDKGDIDAYEARCLEWLTERPERVRPYQYTLSDSRMEAAKHWLWECCKRLLECEKHNRWLTNENACDTWGRECPYAPLCEAIVDGADVDDVILDGFSTKPRHSELGDFTFDGRQIVTYSSLALLALCEQRYFWRLGYELVPGVDSADSRWIGSASHAGLEAYATEGIGAARSAIDTWANDNPVIGEDAAHKQAQDTARAKAIVRAAALRWNEPGCTIDRERIEGGVLAEEERTNRAICNREGSL